MRSLSRLLLLMVLVAAVPADAKTTVIDDSGTLPYDAPLVLHWQQLSPRRPVNNRMIGTLTVRVKLNVAPWLRRPGRIYLVLPVGPLPPVVQEIRANERVSPPASTSAAGTVAVTLTEPPPAVVVR